MKFTTVQVLNITSGVLCSKMDDIYQILDYMTGKELHTMQIPEASEKCEPVILQLYPFFSEISQKTIEMSENKCFSLEKLNELVVAFEKQYGGFFELPQIEKANYDEGVETFMRSGGKILEINSEAPQAVEKLLLEINYLSDD